MTTYFFFTNPGTSIITNNNMTLAVMGIPGQDNVFVCVQYPSAQLLQKLGYTVSPTVAIVKETPKILVLGGLNLDTVSSQPQLPARPEDRFVFFRRTVYEIQQSGDIFNKIQGHASQVGQNIHNLEAVKSAILALCQLVSV